MKPGKFIQVTKIIKEKLLKRILYFGLYVYAFDYTISVSTVSVAIAVIFLSATKVCSTGDEEYNRDHCNCPHPQSHISEHLYETDDAVRDLILQMNIEYWQKFLKEDPDAIYRIPGKYFYFIKRVIINARVEKFSRVMSLFRV